MDDVIGIAAIPLSPREQKILELLADGQSARQVARDLFVTPRMIDRHLENMRLKMRARNTAHMITLAFLGGALRVA
jgi:LuxR family transcriptional regulator, transcriptional regulator of spore coat protein